MNLICIQELKKSFGVIHQLFRALNAILHPVEYCWMSEITEIIFKIRHGWHLWQMFHFKKKLKSIFTSRWAILVNTLLCKSIWPSLLLHVVFFRQVLGDSFIPGGFITEWSVSRQYHYWAFTFFGKGYYVNFRRFLPDFLASVFMSKSRLGAI